MNRGEACVAAYGSAFFFAVLTAARAVVFALTGVELPVGVFTLSAPLLMLTSEVGIVASLPARVFEHFREKTPRLRFAAGAAAHTAGVLQAVMALRVLLPGWLVETPQLGPHEGVLWAAARELTLTALLVLLWLAGPEFCRLNDHPHWWLAAPAALLAWLSGGVFAPAYALSAGIVNGDLGLAVLLCFVVAPVSGAMWAVRLGAEYFP